MGGMATVWRAEHEALKQQVALKLLHARGQPAHVTIKRFQREAQIAASIRHRNIVYLSDFGIDGEEPYIVMELLVGVPLSERIVVGEPLGVGTFLHLIDETLQGLSAVHAAGVVHRDMKPENIFLVREPDGSMYPKLLDFGVSRSTERGQGHTITREGIVMGTPEYISPEQARGRMADVRSDIYSLGVVVYEALAGRLPFHADNSADLIVAVLNATPLPLVSLRPEVGQALSDLLGRAIHRDPVQRFQSADEMRAALSVVVSSEPELAGLFLPRRFLAPTSYGGEHDGENDGTLELPTTHEPKTQAFVPGQYKLPQSFPARWLLLGGALAAALALTFMLSGPSPSAGARSQPPPHDVASLAAGTAPMLGTATAPVVKPTVNEVAVELFGLPSDAQVRADGVVVAGNMLRFARDSGLHAIEVEAPGKEPFRVQHDAARDGHYAISLVAEKRAVQKTARPSAIKTKRGLLRRPDF
jgi:serine/threonine-protein kinase